MKRNNLSLGLSILLAALVLVQGAMAYPSQTNACTNCHSLSSSISISTTSPATVTPGQIFGVSITWSGGSPLATAVKWPSVNDNAAFSLNPAVVVSSSATGTATSTLTAPSAEGSYKVTVYVSTLSGSKITNFKDIVITVKSATTAPVLTTINVLPATANLGVNGTQSFMAKKLDQFNQAISAIVTWANSNTTVGTIDTNGKFTALAEGTTVVTANNGTIYGYVNVTVSKNTKPGNDDDENEADDDIHGHKHKHEDQHHDKKNDSDKKHKEKITEKKHKDNETDKEDD